MIKFMKTLFHKTNDMDAAAFELHDAYMERLLAQTAVEYAQSLVDYNEKRIARLEAYLVQYKEQS